jgi:hypothetical protein
MRINALARWREREGVRPKVALWPVDMIKFSPSLPPYGIPYSLIYAKRSGTASSPLWREEIMLIIFSVILQLNSKGEGGSCQCENNAEKPRCTFIRQS